MFSSPPRDAGETPLINEAMQLMAAGDAEALSTRIASASGEELSVTIESANNDSLLHLAVGGKSMALVDALLNKEVTVGAPLNDDGLSPILLAMRVMPSAIIPMLSHGSGRNVRRIDEDGRNLLHHLVWGAKASAKYSRLPVAKVLVEEHSVSCGHADRFGFTPADWARENYLTLGADVEELIDYLENPPKTDFALRNMKHTSAGEIIRAPFLRFLGVILALLFHIMQYLVDATHRRRPESGGPNASTSAVQPEEDATFNYAFDVFNMIGGNWPTEKDRSTALLITKLACLIIGAGLGLGLGFVVHRLLFRRLLALRIFGAGTASPDKTRGTGIVCIMCIFTTIYCAGKVYNAIIDAEFPDFTDKKMTNRLGISSLTMMKGSMLVTILLDIAILLLVFDTMVQQAAKRLYLPHSSYSGFAAKLHFKYDALRYPIIWCAALLLTIATIAAVAPNWEYLDTAPVSASLSERMFITSLAIAFDIIIMMQEWTVPYLHSIEGVRIPGLPFSSNNAWLLWFLCTILLCLDGRYAMKLVEEITAHQSDVTRTDTALFVLACIPAIGFAILLIAFLLRNSLHWKCCGAADDDLVKPFTNLEEASQPQLQRSTAKSHIPVFDQTPAKAKPTQSSTSTAGRFDDVWGCAFADDVIRMCALLDANPKLLNKRGGCGLHCDQHQQNVSLCSPANPSYAATPLHYAIAGGAKAATSALVGRGANPRIRTSHGMWTSHELASIANNPQCSELLPSH